ncbi:MAG: nucleoside 2-deoxyribosyltransferase [Planctomycetota bacterium]|jgi:nucleoside 2-deoxyribosyltransferase
MKRIVYLAGLISTVYPESLEWRKRLTPLLQDAGFEVRNPLFGKQNLDKETTDGGITSTTATAKDITQRDRRDVRECHVMLTHLELFGSKRPLLGTIAELAWCYDQRTPVVAIAKEDNYLVRNHPFMTEFVSHFVKDEGEAVEFLRRYHTSY